MITSEKLRAARSWVGWTREDLAKISDVSVPTISNIELDKQATPSGKTSERLIKAFRREGIIFTDNGIEKKDSDIRVLEGDKWFVELLEDVYYTLMDKGGELLVDMADDTKSPPDVIEMYRRIRKSGISMRQTVEEGNTYLIGPVKEYRWIPHNRYKNWVTLIYGDKVAVSIDDETKCLLFKDKDFAKAETNKFDLIWDLLPELTIESEANVRF
jgi:DNA-binding XRE family transcriptional regulator